MNPQFIPLQPVPHESQHLHIASLIAHVRPEKLQQLKHWLAESKEVEIHAESAQGKLVLVTESDCEQTIIRILDELRARDGVLNAALVYHEQISLEDVTAEEQDE